MSGSIEPTGAYSKNDAIFPTGDSSQYSLRFSMMGSTLGRDGYPLIFGNFNKERWNYITQIYTEMLQEEVVRNVLSSAAPYIYEVSIQNDFAVFTDIPSDSWQSRAYDMGVREAISNIEWLAGSQDQKIVGTIKAMEGFEDSKGKRRIEDPTQDYFYAEQVITRVNLFVILTGQYAKNRETREPNPNYTKFEAEIEHTPIVADQLQKIYELYQKGIRMGILKKLVEA